jgi:hypothetical protein
MFLGTKPQKETIIIQTLDFGWTVRRQNNFFCSPYASGRPDSHQAPQKKLLVAAE